MTPATHLISEDFIPSFNGPTIDKTEPSEADRRFKTFPKYTSSTTSAETSQKRVFILSREEKNITPDTQEEAIDTRNIVNGAVIKIKQHSVVCNIHINGGIEIELPRSFFPESVSYGFPFELRLDNSSGIRKPLIVPRQLTEEERKKGTKKLTSLIEEI